LVLFWPVAIITQMAALTNYLSIIVWLWTDAWWWFNCLFPLPVDSETCSWWRSTGKEELSVDFFFTQTFQDNWNNATGKSKHIAIPMEFGSQFYSNKTSK
jgi:hypothetical protein